LKNDTLPMKGDMKIHGKDCNEIFDRGYYVVGDSSQVQNWPTNNYGMLIVCSSFPYVIQIAISYTTFTFRLNPYNSANRWEAWQTVK
jgi:hypothetical protein